MSIAQKPVAQRMKLIFLSNTVNAKPLMPTSHLVFAELSLPLPTLYYYRQVSSTISYPRNVLNKTTTDQPATGTLILPC